MALESKDALDRIPSSQPDVDGEIERHDSDVTGTGLPATFRGLLTEMEDSRDWVDVDDFETKRGPRGVSGGKHVGVTDHCGRLRDKYPTYQKVTGKGRRVFLGQNRGRTRRSCGFKRHRGRLF